MLTQARGFVRECAIIIKNLHVIDIYIVVSTQQRTITAICVRQILVGVANFVRGMLH